MKMTQCFKRYKDEEMWIPELNFMLALEKEMLFVFPCWVNFFFLFLFIKRISRILNNEIKKFCANITAKWNWNDLIPSKITNIKAIFYARLHLNFLEHNPSKLQQIYQYTSLEFIYAYALNICCSSGIALNYETIF